MRILFQEQPQEAPPTDGTVPVDGGVQAVDPAAPVNTAPAEDPAAGVLAWLEEYWWLLILVLLFVLLCIGVYLLVQRRMKAQAPPPKEDEAKPKDELPDKKDPDVVGIHQAFQQHEEQLRQYVPGAQYRYQLPWYLMIGEEDAGKTTLLETMYEREDLPLLIGLDPQQRRRNVHWWYFQDAVVLDVPGNYVLAKASGTTRDGLWKAILRQLQVRRRRRPIDGVILAMPCTDFYGPEALTAEALEHKADRIYQKLLDAQRILGLRFPIYLIVTKSDCIPSFEGYLNELPERYRDSIFGWSSPYSLETALAPSWVDEAFDAMGKVVRRSQIELLSDGVDSDDPDGFFVFPSDFDDVREPVNQFLTRLLRPSAYHDAFDLRGIYFTGDGGHMPETVEQLVPQPEPEVFIDADGTGHSLVIYDQDGAEERALVPVAEAPARTTTWEAPFLDEQPRPVFLKQLFQEKIFPEYRLARPLTQRLRYGHRTARAFQVASILVAVLWSIGLIFSYARLRQGEEGRVHTLQTIRDGVQTLRTTPGFTAEDRLNDELVKKLLNDFSGLDGRTLRSVFIPASWFSSINDSLEWAFTTAYEDFIFPSVRLSLRQRADSLIATGFDSPMDAALLLAEPDNSGPSLADQMTQRTNRLLASADSLEVMADQLRVRGNTLIERGEVAQAESLFTVADGLYNEAGVLYDQAEAVYDGVESPRTGRTPAMLGGGAFRRDGGTLGNAASNPLLPFREQPAFRRLQHYVERLVELESYARSYNNVKATESLEDLEAIIEYLFRIQLAAGFQRHAGLYQEALGDVDFSPLRFTVTENERDLADQAAMQLIDALYADIFDDNALYARLENLALELDYLDGIEQRIRARANEAQVQRDLEAGLEAIRSVRLLLENRALTYLNPSANPNLFLRVDSLDASFYNVIDAMRRSSFFSEAPVAYMISQGTAMRDVTRASLLERSSSLTGPILATDAQTQNLRLSPEVEALAARLSRLSDLASLEERGGIRPPIPGYGLQWNVELLRTAADLDLSDYVEQNEDGTASDSYFSGAHFEAAIVDLVRRATVVQTADDAAFLLSHPNLLLENIQNFGSASEFITRILNKLQAVNADKNRRALESLATEQARFLLGIVDRLREQKRLYTLSMPTNLEPGRPLYMPILNVNSSEGVEVYLNTQRSEIQQLARDMAAPLVLFLESTRAVQDEATSQRLAQWRGIVSQVQDYEQKHPGNTLSALEAFLRAVLNATSAEDCLAVVETMTVGGSGYFAERYAANRAMLATRCREEAVGNARREYQALARYFNEFLGGRAPFTDRVVQDEVDPARLQAFLQRYRQYMAVSGDVITRDLRAAGTSTFESVWPFLSNMATVDSLFSAFLADAEDVRPAFDVEVAFRVQQGREPVGRDGIPLGSHIIAWQFQLGNRTIDRNDAAQTGQWVYGEPARLVLRWAKDGPRVPLHDPEQPWLRLGQDRRVTFEALGSWGLLSLLNQHRRGAADIVTDVVLLEFSIPTQAVTTSALEETTVYVQVRLKPPGSNTTLAYPARFPTRAPALE